MTDEMLALYHQISNEQNYETQQEMINELTVDEFAGYLRYIYGNNNISCEETFDGTFVIKKGDQYILGFDENDSLGTVYGVINNNTEIRNELSNTETYQEVDLNKLNTINSTSYHNSNYNYTVEIDVELFEEILEIYDQIYEKLNAAKSLADRSMLTGELSSYYEIINPTSDIKERLEEMIYDYEDIKLKTTASLMAYEQIDGELASQLNSLINSVFVTDTGVSQIEGETIEERRLYISRMISSFETTLRVLKEEYAGLLRITSGDINGMFHLIESLGITQFADYNLEYNEETGSYNIWYLGDVFTYLERNDILDSLNRYFLEDKSWEESGLERTCGDQLRELYNGNINHYYDYLNGEKEEDAEKIFFSFFMMGIGTPDVIENNSGVRIEHNEFYSNIYLYNEYCHEKYESCNTNTGLDYYFSDDLEVIDGFDLTYEEWYHEWLIRNQREYEANYAYYMNDFPTLESFIENERNTANDWVYDEVGHLFKKNYLPTDNPVYYETYALDAEYEEYFVDDKRCSQDETIKRMIKGYVFSSGVLDKFNDINDGLSKSYQYKRDIENLESTLYNLRQYQKIMPFENERTTEEYLNNYYYKEYDTESFEKIAGWINFHNSMQTEDNAKLIEDNMINYLDVSEISMIDYLYHEKGLDEVKNYLNAIEDTINQRIGFSKASKYVSELNEKNILDPIYDTALSMIEGTSDGFENFINGIENLASADGVMSAYDYEVYYKSLLLSSDNEYNTNLSVLGREYNTFIYQIGSSTGNMLIPTLISFIPVVGKPISAASILASSTGNNTESLMQQGLNKYDAYLYGSLMGLSETTIEMICGGLPGSPDNVTKGLRHLIKSTFSESGEEFVQTYISAGIQSCATGQPIDLKETTGEALNAAMMAIFTSAALNGGGTAFIKIADTVIEVSPSKFDTYEAWRSSIETQYRDRHPQLAALFMGSEIENKKINDNIEVLDISREDMPLLDENHKNQITGITYNSETELYEVYLINGEKFTTGNISELNDLTIDEKLHIDNSPNNQLNETGTDLDSVTQEPQITENEVETQVIETSPNETLDNISENIVEDTIQTIEQTPTEMVDTDVVAETVTENTLEDNVTIQNETPSQDTDVQNIESVVETITEDSATVSDTLVTNDSTVINEQTEMVDTNVAAETTETVTENTLEDNVMIQNETPSQDVDVQEFQISLGDAVSNVVLNNDGTFNVTTKYGEVLTVTREGLNSQNFENEILNLNEEHEALLVDDWLLNHTENIDSLISEELGASSEEEGTRQWQIKRKLSKMAQKLNTDVETLSTEIKKALEKVIGESDVGMRVSNDSLLQILESGAIKNIHEVESSTLATPERRKAVEEEFIGIPHQIDGSDSPIYGMLMPKLNGQNDAKTLDFYRNGPGSWYGRGSQNHGTEAIIIFKEDINNYTTLTLGDSYEYGRAPNTTGVSNAIQAPFSVLNPAYTGGAVGMFNQIKTLSDLQNADLYTILPRDNNNDTNGYIEAQIYGRYNHTVDNIDHVVFLTKPSGDVVAKLNEAGIKYIDADHVGETVVGSESLTEIIDSEQATSEVVMSEDELTSATIEETKVDEVIDNVVEDNSTISEIKPSTPAEKINQLETIIRQNLPAGIEIVDDVILANDNNKFFIKFSNGTSLTIDLTNYTENEILNKLSDIQNGERVVETVIEDSDVVSDMPVTSDTVAISEQTIITTLIQRINNSIQESNAFATLSDGTIMPISVDCVGSEFNGQNTDGSWQKFGDSMNISLNVGDTSVINYVLNFRRRSEYSQDYSEVEMEYYNKFYDQNNSDYLRKGYVRFGLQEIAQALFDENVTPQISLAINNDNISSIKVATNAGFVKMFENSYESLYSKFPPNAVELYEKAIQPLKNSGNVELYNKLLASFKNKYQRFSNATRLNTPLEQIDFSSMSIEDIVYVLKNNTAGGSLAGNPSLTYIKDFAKSNVELAEICISNGVYDFINEANKEVLLNVLPQAYIKGYLDFPTLAYCDIDIARICVEKEMYGFLNDANKEVLLEFLPEAWNEGYGGYPRLAFSDIEIAKLCIDNNVPDFIWDLRENILSADANIVELYLNTIFVNNKFLLSLDTLLLENYLSINPNFEINVSNFHNFEKIKIVNMYLNVGNYDLAAKTLSLVEENYFEYNLERNSLLRILPQAYAYGYKGYPQIALSDIEVAEICINNGIFSFVSSSEKGVLLKVLPQAYANGYKDYPGRALRDVDIAKICVDNDIYDFLMMASTKVLSEFLPKVYAKFDSSDMNAPIRARSEIEIARICVNYGVYDFLKDANKQVLLDVLPQAYANGYKGYPNLAKYEIEIAKMCVNNGVYDFLADASKQVVLEFLPQAYSDGYRGCPRAASLSAEVAEICVNNGVYEFLDNFAGYQLQSFSKDILKKVLPIYYSKHDSFNGIPFLAYTDSEIMDIVRASRPNIKMNDVIIGKINDTLQWINGSDGFVARMTNFFGSTVEGSNLSVALKNIFFEEDAMFFSKANINANVNGYCNGLDNSMHIRVTENMIDLGATAIHEGIHNIFHNSENGATGLHIDEKHRGINEAATELFSQIIMGNEYLKPNNCGYYDATIQLKSILDMGIPGLDLESFKNAYANHDNNSIRTALENITEPGYYDMLLVAFYNSTEYQKYEDLQNVVVDLQLRLELSKYQ